MLEESNRKFFTAIEKFIREAKKADPDPITTDIIITYNVESEEVTAERVGGAQTKDGTGGGTTYP